MKTKEKSVDIDLRKADVAYRSFPTFEEWAKCEVDTDRWDIYSAQLNERGKFSAEILERSKEVVRRAAAIDTGALEGLYDVDRGFTFTVATQSVMWEAMMDGKGPKVRALIESQLKAYEYVLTLATQGEPVSEAAIRALHEQVCEAQDTYTAYTEIGIQELRLPKGEYKHLPNHVLGRDGKVHSYAPVDLTPMEMHKLCQELRSEAFQGAHPVLQASYAHYAFVLIHPFADGNGRVARALASIYTYRSHSIPLLILNDTKEDYLLSLSEADRGAPQKFVDFILERALDGIQLVNESLRAALTPSIDDAIQQFKQLYSKQSQMDGQQIDELGERLIVLLYEELDQQITSSEMNEVADISLVKWRNQNVGYPLPNPDFRRALNANREVIINLTLRAKHFSSTRLERTFVLELPVSDSGKDELIIRTLGSNNTFQARLSELSPNTTAALKMRVSVTVQRWLAEAFHELLNKTAKAM